MRINKLTVKNFKGFVDRSFDFPAPAQGNGSFHLVIGQNGKGKTSLLDALAVAAGCWLINVPGHSAPIINDEDIRLEVLEFADTARIEKRIPTEVHANGCALGKHITWTRKRTPNVTSGNTSEISLLTTSVLESIDHKSVIPLIAYYGTGRLWKVYKNPNRSAALETWRKARSWPPGFAEPDLARKFESRLAGYQNCIDPRCNPQNLLDWLKFEQQLALQEQRESTQFSVVKQAIQQSVEGCRKVEYHLRLGLLLDIEGQPRLPFGALSDGQRNMIAMIGDIAYRAAQLNPHLGKEVLQQTPGIVLIDELDLHLHPRWQRHVIEDLRRIFPQVQFIATTHSPFIVQTAREGEIIKLDGDLTVEAPGKTLEEVVRLIMDVTELERSPQYQEKLNVARDYMRLVEESRSATPERKDEIRRELATRLAPFSDNPAYTALLERKGLLNTES